MRRIVSNLTIQFFPYS
ncbi:hypothetical protein FF021_20755 [Leptospira noguchii]|nr:hypothetical protein FF021_20755 [Leptospira noguchii]